MEKPHPYLPNSVPDVKEKMMDDIGIESIDELYSDVPEELLYTGTLDIPGPYTEWEVRREISGILERDAYIAAINDSIRKTYGSKGEMVVEMNVKAVHAALDNLEEVVVPAEATSTIEMPPIVPEDAPEYVREVAGPIMQNIGDTIPVSRMPSVSGVVFRICGGRVSWRLRSYVLVSPWRIACLISGSSEPCSSYIWRSGSSRLRDMSFARLRSGDMYMQ